MERRHFLAGLLTLLLGLSLVVGEQDEDIPHNEVRNWALKFGVDLWEFGRQFTKMNDIKNRFKDSDVEVIRKDGIMLLREMATEVKNFMDFKMNAVMRLMDFAEQAALSESDPEVQTRKNGYFDSRYINQYQSDGRIADDSKEMLVRALRRFEGHPVNLSLSTILVPVGVELSSPETQSALGWSAHLDSLFENNLERDAGLSWQYFGSSTGFMRRFPGTSWPPSSLSGRKEITDFRLDNWFVQAASSPKDIFILLDSSDAMSGKAFQLGLETVSAILDTLGANDFVNVVTFNDQQKVVVPCFQNKMVRATPDNIREMKSAAQAVECDNTANFTGALEMAFEMLHKYNVSGLGSQCNQAIMLLTNGPQETYEEIIKHYNHPHMPVRIFTYLIGKDSTGADNLYSMACSNKGYFAKINSIEDAKQKVIEYALVMARPMILYQADHPVHWSPVFVGGKSGNLDHDDDTRRRLVTSVTTPVFDRRNHSVRVANLLGIVGTDVPIEEIKKMIPQHRLGANAYSFIVDNNGRILYHPDLRPLSDNGDYVASLKPKYHSIDLAEVELPENFEGIVEGYEENSFRNMRYEMAMQKEGESKFSVLTHLDDMKRVSTRNVKYFYGPIEGTPFSLGLALPERYGTHEVKSEQEIRHSHMNVTEFFKGNNWRVNPDWVYCEYNGLKDLEKENENSGESFARGDREETFDTPEEQMLHFLARAGRPGWKWMSLRPRSPQPHHGHGGMPVGQHFAHNNNNNNNNGNTNQGSRKAEPYFCDRQLVQSLVRDAMVTDGLDRKAEYPVRKEDKQQGYQMFGVTTSFVATRSGLFRWIDHIPHPEDSSEPHFSENSARAIDTGWYKRAVDQYQIEPDSFVFSVPFDSGYTGKNSSPVVTATHAIFIEHKGHKAPAAVVGLQFQHESLAKHFINITSACTGTTGCRKTCASDELDCYLLDDNGFVILSERTEHTGKFFGKIDGTIMDSLVQDRIYRRVGLMDYQGTCSDRNNPYTAAGDNVRLTKPWFLNYILTFAMSWLAMLPNPVAAWPHAFYNYDSNEEEMDPHYDDFAYNEEYVMPYEAPPEVHEEDATPQPPPPPKTQQPLLPRVVPDPAHARPCDLKTDLFVLQPDRLNSSGQSNPLKGKLTNCHASGCERPFSVQKIPHSNLILLVVDTLCPCGSKQLDIEPQEIPGGAGACGTRRLSRESLPRKRPPKCINYHPEEIEIQQCAKATTIFTASIYSSIMTFLLIRLLTHA